MRKVYYNKVGVTIKMSKAQLRYNMKIEGFFLSALLPMLGSLATKALPFLTKTILPNLATGALSVVGNVLGQKATKAAVGNGLYLKKGAGKIMQVETDGQGLYLKPYEGSGFGRVGNGLYHK